MIMYLGLANASFIRTNQHFYLAMTDFYLCIYLFIYLFNVCFFLSPTPGPVSHAADGAWDAVHKAFDTDSFSVLHQRTPSQRSFGDFQTLSKLMSKIKK